MGGNRNIGFVLTLIFLMLIKVSAFHVFAHSETDKTSIENCKCCAATKITSEVEIHRVPKFEIVTVFFLPPFKEFTFASQQQGTTESPLKSCLFSRPPPGILIPA